MRIAAISDIHGNLAALDAVLADIGRRGVDRIVNLGDILSGPLDPAATADRLIALDLPTIRGNHERQLLTLEPAAMGASDAHAAPLLTDAHRAWLTSLPATMRLAPDILLCHGTPDSDLDYYLDHVGPDGVRPATADEIAARTGPETAALILCGHTHLPRAHRRPNGQMIVNPGSVGLPAYADDRPFPHVMESGTPQACYAIAERQADGGWTAEPIAVDYDWEAAARAAEAQERPDWAIALRTGRMGS
ncbi:metallophosphoesterase family protein [Rhizorhabdus wittichii]|uniref:Metallophosphoesterase family protein n=1 Tax=Rhizorhabdus wittichii TaxID=160791 RepID=A0A975CZR0_9SPHN|nr:metallophosphoesterase family protein [Rhizorhabdus wittichii]QTH19466.1 metallophosphoesterase family protein [Rhizorhabdus wittichii]